jgi:anaerobic magnesium-protoporphyrin IX monomethyl ester cyclase
MAWHAGKTGSRRDRNQLPTENAMAGAKKLDVVLVNPASRKSVYQSLGNKLAAVENPVWAGLMATFCRTRGLSVEIIDAEADELSPEQVAERVSYLNPVLAAMVVYGHQPSASTQIMAAAGLTCTAIKQVAPEQKILLLGGHVAALPARTLREEAADYTASGEGLHTLVQLVAALKTPKPNFTGVPGLWYRHDGRLWETPDQPLVANLDAEMRGVAWDLLPMTKYRAHNWHCLDGLNRQPYAALYTTLGCPYHCTFCCIQAPFKSGEKSGGVRESTNSYRYWSPDTVIEEIDLLVNKYGVRNIKIADEMFVLNKKHVLGICDRIIERGYDLNIWAYTRVDTIKDNMLEKLKAAGVTWLAFGIEAGADRVRDNVDKSFDQQEVFEVIGKVRAAGINVIGNYIFGLPEDDVETMQSTLDMAVELNCEFGNFYSAMAYPGSPLYTSALRQGVPLPAKWTGYSQHSRDCQPLPTRYITSRDVLSFRDEAFVKYYTNPRYLEMVGRRFGAETVAHINEMTTHRLERDLIAGTLDVPLTTLPKEEAASPVNLQQIELALRPVARSA